MALGKLVGKIEGTSDALGSYAVPVIVWLILARYFASRAEKLSL